MFIGLCFELQGGFDHLELVTARVGLVFLDLLEQGVVSGHGGIIHAGSGRGGLDGLDPGLGRIRTDAVEASVGRVKLDVRHARLKAVRLDGLHADEGRFGFDALNDRAGLDV
jgi:hypothetical protein